MPATAVGPAAGGLLNTGNWQATRASGVGSGFITACTLPLTPQHMPFPGWLHQLTLPLLSSSSLRPLPVCLSCLPASAAARHCGFVPHDSSLDAL